jgi:hypothetical protein
MKRVWIFVALLFAAAGLTQAQTNFTVMTIRTGVDETATNSLITYGLPDTNWIITDITATNGGLFPRDAIVVDREGGWHSSIPLSDTRIISVGTNYGGAGDQWVGVNAAYTFSYSFFIDFLSLTNWTVQGNVWADDSVEVLLNGNRILTTSVIWNQPAVFFSNNDQSFWNNGSNRLDFVVRNSGGGAVGLDANVLITAVPEPKAAALAAIGLLGLMWNVRRIRNCR